MLHSEMQLVKVVQVQLELPAGEFVFDGQFVHAAGPVDALYFPAAHAMHTPSMGPE
jgi:hypothetical protein